MVLENIQDLIDGNRVYRMIVWNKHYTGSKKGRERLKYKVDDLRLLDLQYIEISKRGFYNFYSVIRVNKQDL